MAETSQSVDCMMNSSVLSSSWNANEFQTEIALKLDALTTPAPRE